MTIPRLRDAAMIQLSFVDAVDLFYLIYAVGVFAFMFWYASRLTKPRR